MVMSRGQKMIEHWDLTQLVPQPVYFVSFCLLIIILSGQPLPTYCAFKKKNYSKFHYFFKNKFIYFIYLFLAALGLRCCAQAFSSCGEQGLLFIAVRGLLIAMASLVAEHRLQACRLQQLQHVGSVVVAHGLQSTGSVVVVHGLSCPAACGIFPDQGSNPCPLRWQADSQPLRHQGSPKFHYF